MYSGSKTTVLLAKIASSHSRVLLVGGLCRGWPLGLGSESPSPCRGPTCGLAQPLLQPGRKIGILRKYAIMLNHVSSCRDEKRS